MVCKNVWCLRTEKKGLCKRKALDLCKMVQVHLERFSTNENVFSLRKRAVFSAHTKLSDNEKLFQHTKISISHRTKANEQLQILSAITYCELAVQQSIFEKHQSCVCTTVTLSHRFKAFSPPFCGQNRFRHEPPESFTKSFPAEL